MKSFTVAEMQELDRKAIEEIGIPSIVLMENAGRNTAEAALAMLSHSQKKRVAIFCGTGNNGGDGFVAARHLLREKIPPCVYIVGEKSRIKHDAMVNLHILEKIGLPVSEVFEPIDIHADLIIDAVFGIGFKGKLKDPIKSIIMDLNKKSIPILSLDVPSGLDADTGEVSDVAIKATKTVTMQYPKKGFYVNQGPGHVGEVVAVDIGIPLSLVTW